MILDQSDGGVQVVGADQRVPATGELTEAIRRCDGCPSWGILLVAVRGGDGLMTGETIRDLLKPLIGKSGSISMVVSRTGHIGFVTSGNKKLTGVELRHDGLLRLERETGWAVIDPEGVVAVVWDSEPESSAGQFL
jgi:hypothetical protein